MTRIDRLTAFALTLPTVTDHACPRLQFVAAAYERHLIDAGRTIKLCRACDVHPKHAFRGVADVALADALIGAFLLLERFTETAR